jgi:hypothetical protein
MVFGTLSAPPFSARLAAEMTLPFAVLVPPCEAVPPLPGSVAPGEAAGTDESLEAT